MDAMLVQVEEGKRKRSLRDTWVCVNSLDSQRTALIVKVESYRLTFTNNQRYSVARARDSTCRPAERYEALKGVPLVSMAWFRVPLLCRTVRERLGHASLNPLTVRC